MNSLTNDICDVDYWAKKRLLACLQSTKYGASTHLDGFLDAVVDDEETEDDLAGEHEVVGGRHVAQQFDCAQVPRRHDSSRSRQLRRQSGIISSSSSSSLQTTLALNRRLWPRPTRGVDPLACLGR